MKNTLNVLYSSDDNYAPYLGASIQSLLEHNSDFEKTNIFVIDNKITPENKDRLKEIVCKFIGANLTFFDFSVCEEKLKLDMLWPISLSSYARLFMGEILPVDIERIIYLDCDIIVCDSIRGLWEFELCGNTVGAVQDTVGETAKVKLNIPDNDQYFNAGMLLVDLYAWRKRNTDKRCIDLINQYKGKVYHHDQGVLNAVLHNEMMIVPMRYNTITVHYFFDLKKIRKYYHEYALFYSEIEIDQAKKNPAVLHFTPSFTSRPWVKGCLHPMRDKYQSAISKTPWRNLPLIPNTAKWYVRLIEWRYRVLPF